MQATKSHSNFSATAPRAHSVNDLLSIAIGFLAIGLLLAGASLPRRTPTGASRPPAAQVRIAHPTGREVAPARPHLTPHSR
jgi:hypothetical protein